jgi:heme/copper-type cytochrome/quinol oxidase subunit 2
VHLFLAIVLTLFLAFQAASLMLVLRCRRARLAAGPRARRGLVRTDLVWTTIPILIVLFLAARSWVAVFDIERPAAASAIVQADAEAGTRGASPR